MNQAAFENLMGRHDHGEKMEHALRLVLVRGWKPSRAARRAKVTRQGVHQALLRLSAKHPEEVRLPP